MDTDNDAAELLVDIDEELFAERHLQTVEDMKAKRSWFFVQGLYKGSPTGGWQDVGFTRVRGRKTLALGRSDYYDNFMADFRKSRRRQIFQSDYMVWIEPGDPYRSLNYYIETAAEIHFSLEGVAVSDFRLALEKNFRSSNRSELGSPYMTVWEINQVLYSEALSKTVWYGSSQAQVEEILKLTRDHGGPAHPLVFGRRKPSVPSVAD